MSVCVCVCVCTCVTGERVFACRYEERSEYEAELMSDFTKPMFKGDVVR